MREERIFLEYGVYLSLVCRYVAYFNTVEIELSFVCGFESSYDSQGSGLTASGRSEKRDKFLISYIEVHRINDLFAVV